MTTGRRRFAMIVMAAALSAWSAPGSAGAATASLAAPLEAPRARIMAAHPGGTLQGKVGKKGKVTLTDGQEVTFVEDDAGVGGGDAEATIRVDGKTVRVPNAAVVTEERLRRSPAPALKRDWAIFVAIDSCGDVCHVDAVLLGPGVRAPIGGDVDVDATLEGRAGGIRWRPDGRAVVVEGSETGLASLPDGRVKKLADFQAAAFAPDGRLFVRGEGSERRDNVFEVLADGTLRWITGWPGTLPDDATDPDDPDAPPPEPSVTPVSFSDDGTLVAEFNRPGDKRTVVRIPRAQIGTRPEDLRAEAAFRAARRVEDEKVSAQEAASVARSFLGKATPPWTRELASSANTRGYRLFQDSKADVALPLFEVAAQLDPTYGMPRYNAARVHALRGDAPGAVRWLQQLKAMGASQRARLGETRKDQAFKKIWDTPDYAALGIPAGAPARKGAER